MTWSFSLIIVCPLPSPLPFMPFLGVRVGPKTRTKHLHPPKTAIDSKIICPNFGIFYRFHFSGAMFIPSGKLT